MSRCDVNNSDAVLDQLPVISDTYLNHAEHWVLEAIKLLIIKVTQTSQGNVRRGAAVS